MTEAIFAFNFYILPPGQPAHNVAPVRCGFSSSPRTSQCRVSCGGIFGTDFFLGIPHGAARLQGLDRRCTTQRVSSCFVFLPVCHSPANSAFNEYDLQFFICSLQYIDDSLIWVNCRVITDITYSHPKI